MDITKQEDSDYVGYEYKEVFLNNDKAAEYLDGLLNFGWVISKQLSAPSDIKSSNNHSPNKGSGYANLIILKRNRKIINKVELIRLQRNYEACLEGIKSLEKSANSTPTFVAIMIGLLGTAFMACATFAITADEPSVMLSTFFAIPAFILWISPYLIYKKLLSYKKTKMIPFIEAKYDEIDKICEKGHKIMTE